VQYFPVALLQPPPEWLAQYLDMFMTDGLSQIKAWSILLSLWIQLEAKSGFVEAEGNFGAKDHPWVQTLIFWRAEGRNPEWRPAQDDYDSPEQEDALHEFWMSVFWIGERNWEDLKLVGKSGWLDVLACLFFAGRLGCEGFPMPGADATLDLSVSCRWLEMVGCLVRIFTHLLED
jgi:hypothetical protein